MNHICLIGRITKDPELKKLENGEHTYTRFTLAVNRRFKNSEGNYDADFISCVAWNKTAEVITNNFKKGSEFGIEGRIQTGSYEKEDKTKGYTTDIIVEQITFVGKKASDRPEPEYTGSEASSSAEDIFGEDVVENVVNEDGQVVITDADLPF